MQVVGVGRIFFIVLHIETVWNSTLILLNRKSSCWTGWMKLVEGGKKKKTNPKPSQLIVLCLWQASQGGCKLLGVTLSDVLVITVTSSSALPAFLPFSLILCAMRIFSLTNYKSSFTGWWLGGVIWDWVNAWRNMAIIWYCCSSMSDLGFRSFHLFLWGLMDYWEWITAV